MNDKMKCITYDYFLAEKTPGNIRVRALCNWQHAAINAGYDTISEAMYDLHVVKGLSTNQIYLKYDFPRTIYAILKEMGIFKPSVSGRRHISDTGRIRSLQEDYMAGGFKTWGTFARRHGVGIRTAQKYTREMGLPCPEHKRDLTQKSQRAAETIEAKIAINRFFAEQKHKYENADLEPR